MEVKKEVIRIKKEFYEIIKYPQWGKNERNEQKQVIREIYKHHTSKYYIIRGQVE